MYEITDCAFVGVVVVRLLLQCFHQRSRIFIRPVCKHHHEVAVILKRLRLFGIDDQWAVYTYLFLETGVTVIPVGSVLLDLELIDIGAIRFNPMEAQAWHTVHVRRKDNSVPMDRSHILEAVLDPQGHGIALTPAQLGPRNTTVYRHGRPGISGDIY